MHEWNGSKSKCLLLHKGYSLSPQKPQQCSAFKDELARTQEPLQAVALLLSLDIWLRGFTVDEHQTPLEVALQQGRRCSIAA